VERGCLKELGTLVQHHDVKVQCMAANCIGQLGRYRINVQRLVSDGALLPLISLLANNQHRDILIECCIALTKLYLNRKSTKIEAN
jgi:hypothetical protein